ncbi:MAG: PaaI family thioesterase [Eubacterium sp.]|jgi:acyl-CoA thioesterase|nr:PaaI family thioesterase [Eubacterium sp.]
MDQKLLEEYQAVMDQNPFAVMLGIEFLEIEKGIARARVKKKRQLENIYGDLHGGCLYTVADNLAGIAAGSYGFYVTTVSGSIQYLKAARDTDYIICEAKVLKAGKTISAVHVEITDERGLLLNTAEFTFFNLKEKAGGRYGQRRI